MSKVETLRSRCAVHQAAAAAAERRRYAPGRREQRPVRGAALPGVAGRLSRPLPGQRRLLPYDSLSPEDEELLDFTTWLS
ncbi:hypothetical protein CEXT_10871 [Caerostris extrusa]|uniref:Uncharacterized protein n=1 Tax=Caerostris extrusa TaxID=172846 RepID=A0AAV4NPZ1_CAEEX|nr:hypothetical protein CEXT_10871 [Caerostris extrusa]